MNMKHFTKAVCILDTCSIIYLDEIVLGRKDLLTYMRTDFDVHVSDVIVQEYTRHKDKMHGLESSYWLRFLNSRNEVPSHLKRDSETLGVFHASPPAFCGTENAGEYGNARLAIEMLMSCRAGQVVFVTDDERACRAFLGSLRETFPGITLWSSLDVIFYVAGILMVKGMITGEDVDAAARDLVAASPRWETLNEEEKSKLIKRRADARKRRQRLETVTKEWRR